MATELIKNSSTEEEIARLFSYKAEWLKEQMFDLFSEPSYFGSLTTNRPCVLKGGRGTGKTTVLKCMSYEGQYALTGRRSPEVPKWRYYGFYYRVNTNRIRAFKGAELGDERWLKIFAHYINLLFCKRIFGFLHWYKTILPLSEEFSVEQCALIADSLHVERAATVESLLKAIEQGQNNFEAEINNIAEAEVKLSLQGKPIDLIFQELKKLPQFRSKEFFLIIDEFENFEEYQQKVVNTLLKHSGPNYSFKIGIKELGWKCKTTINAEERLNSPADYVLIDIAEVLNKSKFAKFALRVCNERISRISAKDSNGDISKVLSALSAEEEAELLDGEGKGVAKNLASKVERKLKNSQKVIFRKKPLLERYAIGYLADMERVPYEKAFEKSIRSSNVWKTRYNNYKYALLFTIKRGKTGIKKYYCGVDTFAQLSGGNIRYFLELVEQSLIAHVRQGKEFGSVVNCETQTLAADKVGKKNLGELEGLTVDGANLVKLLHALGRVFHAIAVNLNSRAPEVTQFHISVARDDEGDPVRVEKLLNSAVMNMALVRYTGSKLSGDLDLKDYDYAVHPIFSAFFQTNYRRKRKMIVKGSDFLQLVENPTLGMRNMLKGGDNIFEGDIGQLDFLEHL